MAGFLRVCSVSIVGLYIIAPGVIPFKFPLVRAAAGSSRGGRGN